MAFTSADKQAAARGAIIGTAVGFLLSGPIFAVLGGGLSAVLGGLFGTTIDKMTVRL